MICSGHLSIEFPKHIVDRVWVALPEHVIDHFDYIRSTHFAHVLHHYYDTGRIFSASLEFAQDVVGVSIGVLIQLDIGHRLLHKVPAVIDTVLVRLLPFKEVGEILAGKVGDFLSFFLRLICGPG